MSKFTSKNPATGETLWESEYSSKEQIHAIIKQARDAYKSWKLVSFEERSKIARNFAEALKSKKEALALTISKETAKPLWESKTEVDAAVGKIEISINAYKERCKVFEGGPALTRFKPIGTLAVIGPYNFPLHLPNGHIIPALLAGNTIVLKPSEQTPLVAEEYISIWKEIDIPEGVINLVHGTAEESKFLCEHKDINGVLFTGSAKVGIEINKTLSEDLSKIIALEMGGNNPLVVHETSDLETAAYITIQSAFITAGQRCACARRLILVEGSECDQFIKTLADKVNKIKVGPYTDDPEPFMGPLISETAAGSVLDKQKNLLLQGAKGIVKLEALSQGSSFLSPGIIDVTEAANREDEEIFGPILQIIRVPDFEAAIKEANNTKYGLTAGIITDNKNLHAKFYNEVNAGIINWNKPTTGASSAVPFGGVGHSGNYRPSAFFAADYCAYPVASIDSPSIEKPQTLPPGIE